MSAEERTPTLEEVIMMGVESRLFDIHTCLPATVEKYDAATQTVDVKPSLMRKYEAEAAAVALPVINSVPVVFPRGSASSITFPIKAGDSVLLVFSERSIDVWKSKGGTVDPADPRKFDLSDAFAIPGAYPSTKKLGTAHAEHTRFENGAGRIEIQDGKFRIEKVGGDEVLTLVIDLMAELITTLTKLNSATVNTINGPTQLNNFQDYATIKDAVTELKGKLTALRG